MSFTVLIVLEGQLDKITDPSLHGEVVVVVADTSHSFSSSAPSWTASATNTASISTSPSSSSSPPTTFYSPTSAGQWLSASASSSFVSW